MNSFVKYFLSALLLVTPIRALAAEAPADFSATVLDYTTPQQIIFGVQNTAPVTACISAFPDNTAYTSYVGLPAGCTMKAATALTASTVVFSGYTCSSTPSSLCSTLGTGGANVVISFDKEGCVPPPGTICTDTLFFGYSPGDSGQTFPTEPGVVGGVGLNLPQHLDVTFSGTVSGGSTHNGPWPHWKISNVASTGQASTGTITLNTAIGCGVGTTCLLPPSGTNQLVCNLANNGTPSIATITGTSITSDVLTVTISATTPISYTAGEVVQLYGTKEGYLNNQYVTVLSTGLTTTQFEASFTHGNESNNADTGNSAFPNCNEMPSIVPYNPFNTTYTAPGSGIYSWSFEIILDGGSNSSGTAWLKDLAFHF
jgi:hypothetical protein